MHSSQRWCGLYAPWLDKSARRFQELATQNEAEYRRLVSGVKAEPETRLVFADGLRFDVAGMLQRVGATWAESEAWHRLAPFPTVTATAKQSPASSCGVKAPHRPRISTPSCGQQATGDARACATRWLGMVSRYWTLTRRRWLPTPKRVAGQRSGVWTRWAIRWGGARTAHRRRDRGDCRSRLGLARHGVDARSCGDRSRLAARAGRHAQSGAAGSPGCHRGRGVPPCKASRARTCPRSGGSGTPTHASPRRRVLARSSSTPNTPMAGSARRSALCPTCWWSRAKSR